MMKPLLKKSILRHIEESGIELAQLSGSDKQIQWAEEIRLYVIDLLGVSKVAKCQKIIDCINKITDSTWWISNDSKLGLNVQQTLDTLASTLK